MKVRSSIRIGMLAIIAFTGIALGLFLWQPVWLFHSRELRTGKEMVTRIETFRTSHGRLPETLKEVGINDPDPNVFYRKIGDDGYSVWFGTTLGESEIYDSHTKKWN